MMYYSKDSENLGEEMMDMLFGCKMPLSAGSQKETFQALVEETLGETCEFEAVKNLHEKMGELIEEHKEELQPLVLDRNEVKTLFAQSGVANSIKKGGFYMGSPAIDAGIWRRAVVRFKQSGQR